MVINMLQYLFKNETTIRVIDLFINNIQKSGKLCELYTISFEELLEEINNNTQYKKISVSELKSVLQHLMKFNVIRKVTILNVTYGMDSYWYYIFTGIRDKIMWYLW